MIEISEKFNPLFNPPKGVDTFIVTGGRYSQKSFAVSTSAVHGCKEYGHRSLYTRFTNTSAKDSTFPEIEEKIMMLGWEDYFNVTTNRVESLFSKAKIVFKGLKTGSLKQTANLKSLKDFSAWYLEEAEEQDDEEIYDKTILSIRGNPKGSSVPNINVMILNPTTKEHFLYKRFFEDMGVSPGFNGVKDNVCYIHTTYLDCIDFVPDNFLRIFEEARKCYELYLDTKRSERESLPHKTKKLHNYYKYTVLGGWLEKAEGVIFEDWKEGEFDESLPYIWGADYGYVTDESTLVKVAVKDNKLYLKEYMYLQGLSTQQIADEYNKHIGKNELIVGDNAEPRLINELWDMSFNIQPCTKGKDSIRNGIANMQEMEIIIDPDSHNLKKELNNYAWHDKKSNTPIDNYNHLIDAARYAFTDLTDGNDFFIA